jgi:uncharacterized protein (TIGR03000 family)
MFSVVVAAMAAMPGQVVFYGGYLPVRSTYWCPPCPPCGPYYGVYCAPVECEDPLEKRLKAIEKKLKGLDDRMEKLEATGKKLEKDLKDQSDDAKKQFKDFEKKNEERLQAFEKKQEESLKAAEQKSDERLKAQAERQEDRVRNLEQRSGDQLKNLEQRSGDQLKNLDSKWDERFRSQEEKARALELKLLEDRMAQSLKKLEEKVAEAERLKNLEGKIEDRAKGVESKIDERLRQTLEPLAKELQMIHEKVRMLEKGDLGKKTKEQEKQFRSLEQKLDALELRLKGKVDVLEERLKGFDGRLQDGKQALERLIDALRKRKKEADEQGTDQLDERIRKIEGDLQDVQKLQDRLRDLENRTGGKRPALEIVVPAVRRVSELAPATIEPIKVPAKRALIVIELPADAKLFINDQLKEATGQTIRYIQTPNLEDQDEYFYQVRVEVMRGGKTLSETKRVDFRAGRQVRVSFNRFGAAETPLRTAMSE